MKQTLINRLMKLLVLFAILAAASCNQDSIFFYLAMEPPPKDPTIPGTPTNLVVVGDTLYVTSRQSKAVRSYGTNPDYIEGSEEAEYAWVKIENEPGGSIYQLATDGTYLYALVSEGDILQSSLIKRFNPDDPDAEWVTMGHSNATGYSIQSLYGAGDQIFAGGQLNSNRSSYRIFYLDNDELTSISDQGTWFLTGAAKLENSSDTYLSTKYGVFKYSVGSNAEQLDIDLSERPIINGIIATSASIIAVRSNGKIYYNLDKYDPGIEYTSFYSTGAKYTGGMGIWKNYSSGDGEEQLLLLGIQNSTRNHGYREILLDEEGNPSGGNRTPGSNTLSSIKYGTKAKYDAGLGRYPIYDILQLPDGVVDYQKNIDADPNWEPPIFAATAAKGLWSYKDRGSDGWIWNAED